MSMADKSSSQLNIEVGQRIQEKFDAYLLGLIFTTLALSLQTAKFGTYLIADSLELVSWMLLLIAGLAGLSRLEWIPELYRLISLRHEKEELAHGAEKARLQGAKELHVVPLGRAVPTDQFIAEAKDSVAKVEKHLEPLERRGLKKYKTMKYCFVAGLFTLICARGYGPLRHIIDAWPWRFAL
jgi:hypothetical protein